MHLQQRNARKAPYRAPGDVPGGDLVPLLNLLQESDFRRLLAEFGDLSPERVEAGDLVGGIVVRVLDDTAV